ncbi:putative uncharacterized protein FLJ37770 [Harpegnathos saltator]|uniref:putative uncharacterized protein FLJ37770 n=1 Tax=Harpegnathos saltator TaxID=610380 RepID=UPI000DBEE48F|nr:putative uncharacterized protein FLJ37770 [Harpegnathos saltator]
MSKTYNSVCLAIFCVTKMLGQRVCLKFCVKNGIKCSEAFKMLKKAFDDDTISQPRVHEWYERFQEGREDIEDDARSGRPSTSTSDENVEKVKETVLANRSITIREVAEEIGTSYGSCEAIFTNVSNIKRFIQQFSAPHRCDAATTLFSRHGPL